MKRYAQEFVARHRGTGIVIDANLLLLLVIGRWNVRRIETLQRTRNHFLAADFVRLGEILSPVERLIATPHILTEVSNLANQLEGREREAVYSIIAGSLPHLIVQGVSTRAVANTAEFRT